MPNKVQKKKKVNGITDIVKKIKSLRGTGQKFTENEIKELLNSLLEVIENRLEARESVEFRGFFTLSTRTQPAKEMIMRFGKDKGKKKKIPAKFVPTCKFSPAFKKLIA
jgi:nucleoid DNA-binding protein